MDPPPPPQPQAYSAAPPQPQAYSAAPPQPQAYSAAPPQPQAYSAAPPQPQAYSAAPPQPQAYSSIPPPPPPAAWRCDGCGRQNGRSRYMCQQCRGYNTYDLCEQCIGRVNVLHPSHTFQLVSQSPW